MQATQRVRLSIPIVLALAAQRAQSVVITWQVSQELSANSDITFSQPCVELIPGGADVGGTGGLQPLQFSQEFAFAPHDSYTEHVQKAYMSGLCPLGCFLGVLLLILGVPYATRAKNVASFLFGIALRLESPSLGNKKSLMWP